MITIKNKRKISLMIIVIITLQILLLAITIISESKFIIKSIAKEISTQSSMTKINSISELNTDTDIINSHEGDTKNSNLEFNYRESKKLVQGKQDGDWIFNEPDFNNDEGLNNLKKEDLENLKKYFGDNATNYHMGYPRLKKLKKETEEGYKYILTFQDSVSTNHVGINVYYTRSTNLKDWTKPEILFKGRKDIGNDKYRDFTSCDTLVLEDGTILSVSSKWGAYKDEGYTVESFNNNRGLYVKISTDNGESWTEEKKIYTGSCWEPSIIELSTGEIQIYFTHKAPGLYVAGKEIKSTGVALISSLDQGRSWTPDVKGATSEYNEQETKNPYSAYRISQQKVRGKMYYTDDENNRKIKITDPLDFNKVTVSGDSSYKGGLNKDGKLATKEEAAYKITNQMPVAIELNNKDRIALVSESLAGWLESEDDTEVDRRYYISISYSDKKEITIQGEEVKKEKYWLDLREENNDSIVYKNEEEVYDNEGLGILEEGPVNHNFLEFSGLAPYIQQFPSGETVVSYNKYYSDIQYPTLRVGDTDANFMDSTEFRYDKDSGFGFASISLLSSHCIGLITASSYKEGEETKPYIGIYPMQLNHTINAEEISNVSWEKDDAIVWNDNTDALFIGSESQAQVAIRVAYDNDNIYFLVDRLDNSLTDEDTIDLYINTNSENNDYYKMVLSKDGVKEFKSYIQNSETDLLGMSNVIYKVYVNDTNDENGGYKVLAAIPKSELSQINDSINLSAVLNNEDECSETIVADTFTKVNLKDTTTWNKVRFTQKIVPTIDYDIKTLTNDNVNVKIAFNKENVKITNNEGKDTYIFTENGSFTFEYVDEVGKTGSAVAKVDWIDKTAPIINEIICSTEEITKSLILTVDAIDNESKIVGYSWDEGKTWTTSNKYTINQNGIYKVLVKDEAENITTKDIEITNIEYFKINTYEIKENYIVGIEANTNLNRLTDSIDTNLQYSIVDKNENIITDGNTLVATGMKIRMQNGSLYTIAIKGDLNSDGIVDISDLGVLAAYIVGKGTLKNEYFLAGDINGSGIVDISDLSIIANLIVK